MNAPLAIWVPGAPESVYLKRTVILSHVDINAAAIRALLGIDMRLEFWPLELEALEAKKVACQHAEGTPIFDKEFTPVQVLNCKYEEFSLIVVNTILKDVECHQVVLALFDLFAKWNVERVLFLSAVLGSGRIGGDGSQQLQEMAIHTEPLTKRSKPPEATRIRDTFLNTFIQFASVEGLALNLFLMPGKRAKEGTPNRQDGSLQNIQKFQEMLTELFKLRFSRDIENGFVFRRSTEDDPTALLYM